MKIISKFQSLSLRAKKSVVRKTLFFFTLPAALISLTISIDFTEEVSIVKYEPGMVVYEDRDYGDVKKELSGDNLFVAISPRHLYTRVFIQSDKPIRLITAMDSNYPTDDLRDWEKMDIPFFIPAKGLKMDTLLAKKLDAGTHPIPLGHELANPPIFIEKLYEDTKLQAWKILEFNKPHIIGSIWKYKRRMVLILFIWLLWGAMCFTAFTIRKTKTHIGDSCKN